MTRGRRPVPRPWKSPFGHEKSASKTPGSSEWHVRKAIAAASIWKMLSVVIRWVTHLWDGWMHSVEYLRSHEHTWPQSNSCNRRPKRFRRANEEPLCVEFAGYGNKYCSACTKTNGEGRPLEAWLGNPQKRTLPQFSLQSREHCTAVHLAQSRFHVWRPQAPQIQSSTLSSSNYEASVVQTSGYPLPAPKKTPRWFWHNLFATS